MRAPGGILLLLAILLFIVGALSLGVGAIPIPAARVLEVLLVGEDSQPPPVDAVILWQLRMPRILLAALIGAGLAMAGAGYQGLFRNPLADPFVIGASSGAALGATIAMISGLQWGQLGAAAIPAMAMVGALLAVSIVYGIATVGGQVPLLSLLLAGVAVSSFISALVSLLMFLNEENLASIVGWLMGSLSGDGWPILRVTAPLILISGLMLWSLSRSLDSLTFGEETAASLGLRLTRLRAMVVIAASIATAASVAAAGIIGFVGLIAPHLARLSVGARHAYVIPASGLIGGLLLLVADGLARTLAAPAELPVGVVTALLGSPFFLYLLKSRSRELGAGG